jgi:hypothetical protein
MLAGVAAPVLYWEQGHEWLFGDPVRLQVAQNFLKQDVVRRRCGAQGSSNARSVGRSSCSVSANQLPPPT